MTSPIVLKFGGTSVADADAFARVAEIVTSHGGPRPVVVVSAMSGVTDALAAAVSTAAPALDDHWERHRAVARRLLASVHAETFEAHLGRAREALPALLGRGDSDGVLALGEQLCSTLLAAVLAARGLPARAVDARRCIITDEMPGRAVPLFPDTDQRTRQALDPLLDEGAIPVLGGFIGATRDGRTTTLGRGGSDYSAALVGAALDAAEVQIWTDVCGVMTADPRIVKGAHTIPRLSYAEAAELAYFGAKVLHPRTIQPAMDRGIPVRIGNSRAPAGPATIVSGQADVWPEAIKAIAHKTGITVVQVTSARMFGAYGFLRALFEVFDRHKTSIDVVSTSEVSVSLSLDDTSALAPILDELRTFGRVEVEPGRAIVCVVGEGLRRTPGVAARVFQTIQDINILLISQGASQLNLTFVVEEAQVADAVVRLHDAVLETAGAAAGVGP
jgi:aspartate kinase